MTTSMGPAAGGSAPRLGTRSGLRAAIVIAAAGSAGAGLVHAAAAGSHDGGGSLVWLFALCAAAQLGWAAAVVAAPTRSVLLVGAGINGAAVVTWFVTRTVGLPVIDALAEVEAVGTPDLVAAALGAFAVAGAVIALTMPIARRTMPATWSAMVVVGTVALVVPAMAAGHGHRDDHAHLASEEVHAGAEVHAHDDSESAHGDNHGGSSDEADGTQGHDDDDADHANGNHSDDGGAHLTSTGNGTHDQSDHPDSGHDNPGDPPHNPGDPSHNPGDPPHNPGDPSHNPGDPPHNPGDPSHNPGDPSHNPGDPSHNPGDPPPTGPIVSLDDPRLTAAQRTAGSNLLVTTLQGMTPFPDVQAVEAAGYRSIGDLATGFEHFVNWTYFNDGIELDPGRIESIVIKIGPNGEKTVASGMYILNLGKSLADVPDISGPLTVWHDHTNLCWVPNGEGGMRLSGVTDANGNCARGTNIVTPPMLHVWLTPQPCGPFSGIEGTHGEACAHGH